MWVASLKRSLFSFRADGRPVALAIVSSEWQSTSSWMSFLHLMHSQVNLALTDTLYCLHLSPRLCTSNIPMQLLALGLPRSVIKTLRQALLILGYTQTFRGFDLASLTTRTLRRVKTFSLGRRSPLEYIQVTC